MRKCARKVALMFYYFQYFSIFIFSLHKNELLKMKSQRRKEREKFYGPWKTQYYDVEMHLLSLSHHITSAFIKFQWCHSYAFELHMYTLGSSVFACVFCEERKNSEWSGLLKCFHCVIYWINDPFEKSSSSSFAAIV